MEELFEFEGQKYTLAEVQKAADAKSLNIDDYIKQYNISRGTGKTTPTAPGAVVEGIAAPEPTITELQSEDISLELPETATFESTLITQKELDVKESQRKEDIERIGRISPMQSIKAAFSGLSKDVKTGISPYLLQDTPALDIASASIAEGIFGKDNVNKYVQKYGKDSFLTEGLGTEDLLKGIEEYNKQQLERGETLPVIESFKQGEIAKGLAGVVSAGISGLGSLARYAPTFGGMAYVDFVAENYVDFNEGKAARNNKSLQSLINDGEAEIAAPVAAAAVMQVFETLSYGKMTGALRKTAGKALRQKAAKITADVVETGRTELITEMLQYSVGEYNKELGKTGDQSKAGAIGILSFFSDEAAEAGIQGFIGGAGIKGSGYALKSVSNLRAAADKKGIESDLNEYTRLNKQLLEATDETVKEGIQKSIDEVNKRLQDRVVKSNSVLPNFSNKDIDEITNLDKLAELQVERVKNLREKLNTNKITLEEHNLALEGFKKSYLDAKNKINGVKTKVDDRSNKEAQEVNKLYEEKGKEGIAEILELYRPMAKRIVSKYKNVPGFEMELMVDEVLTGKRGILDLINSYKSEMNVPLSAYINKYAASRGIEAAQRNLKQEFELDVTEAKGVTDVTETDTDIEIKEQASQQIKTELAKDLNLDPSIQEDVMKAVEKTLGTKLPAVTDKKFKQALTIGLRTELKNTFKSMFGRTEAYESFLSNNFKKIYNAIPQETINKKFKEFNQAIVDPKTGKQLREKTAEGKKVFEKRDITKAEFLKYFIGSDVKASTKGVRKTSLAEVLADEIGLDNILKALAKPEVVERFKGIQELQGQEVPSNFRAIIAKTINRLDEFIIAAKKFENDPGILRADFGFSNAIIKGIRLFAETLKFSLEQGVNIIGAVKTAVDKFKESLKDSGQTEVEIDDINKSIDTVLNSEKLASEIKNGNLKSILKPDTLANKIIIEAVRNSKKEIKNYFTKAIKEIKTPEQLGEFLETNLTAFRNSFSNKDGFDLNRNELIERYIKKIISEELYNSMDFNIRPSITIRQSDNKKFIEKLTKNREKHIEDQKAQAKYMRNLVIKTVNDFKRKYEIDKSENVVKEAYRWFQMQGSNMNTPFKLSQPIRLIAEVNGKPIESVLEHNFPAKDQVRIYLEYITGNISYEQLNKFLSNATLDIMPKQLENIYNVEEDMKDTLGKDFDFLNDDPKNKRYSKKYLSKTKELNINIIDLKDSEKKEKTTLNRQFNEILQNSKGVEWQEKFSPVTARMVGKGKGKRKFFIPYSADDFVGLLYATLGTKEKGDAQMKWYEEKLLKPFSRAIQQFEASKQKSLREWIALKKEVVKNVPGGLNKVNSSGFTNQTSVRLYIWKKQGMDIPDVTLSEINKAIEIVSNNEVLKNFADRLMTINAEGYPKPSAKWDMGDITTDLVSYVNEVKRSEFLKEWKDNKNIIFSDDNKNKLRAIFGDSYIEALNDILYRMEFGGSRRAGLSKVERNFMDWTNNSVGAIMFFNARSAVLQTLSAVNFINFTDNNPIKAGLALANFPQYTKDFLALFNSDFLKQRRSGLQIDVSADEIANAAATSKNKAKAMFNAIIKAGFTPTQIADSFAIASGGATFYRNRIEKYIKEGLSEMEAKSKAFTDFQEIAEETQQSARPDRISMQQAGSLGRIILAFGNTPMQYARLTKKAALDLINGRGDWKTNISKIMYYSVIQNIIFSALQQALFSLLFSDEEDDDEKKRLFRIGNSSLDTLLRGAGVYGAAASTVKNMIIKTIEESKKSRPDYTKIAIEATSLSPPINSKLRKLISAGKTFTYKQSLEKVYSEGFSLENPAFLAAGQVISAGTNLPVDRIVTKADHLYTAMQPETELWQAIALSLGYSEWDLNMIEKETKKSSKFKKFTKFKKFKK